MTNLSENIRHAAQSTFNSMRTLGNWATVPLSTANTTANTIVGYLGFPDDAKNMIKTTVALSIFTGVFYPSLEPFINKRMPNLAVSHKLVQSFKTSLDAIQTTTQVTALVTIANVLSKQSTLKLESDGYKVIIPQAMKKEDNITRPIYNDYINNKINEFSENITNTSVIHNKKNGKIQSFIFHGPAGTGKSSITKYLAQKFNNTNEGQTYHYKLSNSNFTDKMDWQLDQIINFINGKECDINGLEENLKKSIKEKFKSDTDNICIELDEIDQLGNKSERLQRFYDALKETNQNILFMGTTNKLNEIPAPIKSRSRELYIGFPNTDQKNNILGGLCKDLEFTKNGINIKTDGLSNKLQEKEAWQTIILDNDKISGRTIANIFTDTINIFSAELSKDNSYMNNDTLNEKCLNKIAEIFGKKLNEATGDAQQNNILGYDVAEEEKQKKWQA